MAGRLGAAMSSGRHGRPRADGNRVQQHGAVDDARKMAHEAASRFGRSLAFGAFAFQVGNRTTALGEELRMARRSRASGCVSPG